MSSARRALRIEIGYDLGSVAEWIRFSLHGENYVLARRSDVTSARGPEATSFDELSAWHVRRVLAAAVADPRRAASIRAFLGSRVVGFQYEAPTPQPSELTAWLERARGDVALFRVVRTRYTVDLALDGFADVVEDLLPPGTEEETEDYIEFVLRDPEGKPVSQVAFLDYEITLPDGRKRAGKLDADGYAHVGPIPSGQCEIEFVGLEDPRPPDNSVPLPPSRLDSFIEFLIQREDGEPLADQLCEIILSTGQVQVHRSGPDGMVRIDDIPFGVCQFRMTEVQDSLWHRVEHER